VFLVVEGDRREAERVLAVQLLGDARESRCELVGFLQLEEAAARLLRQLAQAAVGPRAHPAHAVEVFRLHPDRVDHHLFVTGAVEDVA
jgi:hypothetical protein